MSVYCIRNSSPFLVLDPSPSCHPLPPAPPVFIIRASLFNISEIRRKVGLVFFGGGGGGIRDNTLMKGFGNRSPTHFPPFSPRFEVSEARTSHPFPPHHLCSLIRPGVTPDMCHHSAEAQQPQSSLARAGRWGQSPGDVWERKRPHHPTTIH